MKNKLLIRILSAVAVIILFGLSYVFAGIKGLYWVGMFICLIASWEYGQISFGKAGFLPSTFLTLAAGLCMWLGPDRLSSIVPVSILFSCILIWLSREKLSNSELLSLLKAFFTGILYVGVLPSFALSLLNLGGAIFLGLLVMIFSADIFAYFGGISMGKTAFYPQLSPKKTVEGALFGIAGSMIVSACYFYFTQLATIDHLWKVAGASIVIVITSQTGDLFESLLKREAGVKDSGKIMPGHGGALDRLDAVYFAAPVFWFWIQFII